MKTVGIIFNPEKKLAQLEAAKLKKLLIRKKCNVVVMPSSLEIFPSMDIALSLGGDGTMLKTGRCLAPLGIPVLGINMGTLGFLAETNPKEAPLFITNIISGKYEIEERMLLDVTIKSGKKTCRQSALNDCTIHSGYNGRIINVEAKVNGEFLAKYPADGLIIATPTGSTAYSLAASGPIVHPQLSVFILTPVCPHSLNQRPLIISTEHSLNICVTSKSKDRNPIISFDGQVNFPLMPGDLVSVGRAKKPLRLIVNPNRNYYQILRTKLKWGER